MRRVLQGWSLAATHAEYDRYAGEKGEADLEVSAGAAVSGGVLMGVGGQFIELFNPHLEYERAFSPPWLREDI